MLRTLATIPEEPGSEAHELEKLSICELQLRLSTERARLAELQPEDSGVSGTSLVLHKCAVRGCISEPAGFGRGRQSPFPEGCGDVSKPEGYGLVASSGDWRLGAGKNAMKKSSALAEHWNVALGEWDDESIAQPAETTPSGGGGVNEVGGYPRLEYKVESEEGAGPMTNTEPTNLEEEFEFRFAAGRGDSPISSEREDFVQQGDGERLHSRAGRGESEGDTAHGFAEDGGPLDDWRMDVKDAGQSEFGEPTNTDWTDFHIPDLRAGNSSCYTGANSGDGAVRDAAASRICGSVFSSAKEREKQTQGSCEVAGLWPKNMQPDVGGQDLNHPCQTFLAIPRPNLVPAGKVEPWSPSELTPGPESSGDSSLLAASLPEVQGEVLSASAPDFFEPVPIAGQDIEGGQAEECQDDVPEEGSYAGGMDRGTAGTGSIQRDRRARVALGNHIVVGHVADLGIGAQQGCCDGLGETTIEEAGSIVPIQELKKENQGWPVEGFVGAPCEAVPVCLPPHASSQHDETSKQDQSAPAGVRVQVCGEVSTTGDDPMADGVSKGVGSSFGSNRVLEDSVLPVHRSGNYRVSEVLVLMVGDPSPVTDCRVSCSGDPSPALDDDGLLSSSATDDKHEVLAGSGVLQSSVSQDIVRQVAQHRAPCIPDDVKDNEGILSDSLVQSLTAMSATGAAYVTSESVLDSGKNKPGLPTPGEYTTLLKKEGRKIPSPATGNGSSKNPESANGESLRGGDDEAMAPKFLPPHPRSPLLDMQDRVSFGVIGHTASDLRSDTTEELGEVTGLVDALVSDSLEARCLAAEKIRILTRYNAKARTRMGQVDATDRSGRHGLIPALVAFLPSLHYDQVDQPPPPALRKAQEMAACALLNLGINNDRNKAAIVAAGAVPELVELLRGNAGARTKEAAVGALLTLSCLQENHAHMGSTRGTISQLVHVLRRGTKQACKDALTALNNLTASMSNRQRMVRAGAVRALTRLLATGDYGESPQPDDPLIQDAIIGEKCVALLYNLSFSKEGREAILNTNGTLAVLCEMLDSELSTVKEKEHAASTLWNLCINSAYHCQLVKEEGVTPALIALSVEGSPRAQEKARLLLTQLSSICDTRSSWQEHGSVRNRTAGSLPRQLELALADDGYLASESEKSLENSSSPSDSLCSTPASQPLRMQWSGPEVHHSAPLERPSTQNRKAGIKRSVFSSLLKHINPLARHNRSASSLVPFGRKS